jgi:hypothetical protein
MPSSVTTDRRGLAAAQRGPEQAGQTLVLLASSRVRSGSGRVVHRGMGWLLNAVRLKE